VEAFFACSDVDLGTPCEQFGDECSVTTLRFTSRALVLEIRLSDDGLLGRGGDLEEGDRRPSG
jgi:hypothetical protein